MNQEFARAKMVRKVVVPLTHQSSNSNFDTAVSHLGGILFSGRRRSRRQRDVCGDFVNLNTRPLAQSFGGAHTSRVFVRAFIGVTVCTCM